MSLELLPVMHGELLRTVLWLVIGTCLANLLGESDLGLLEDLVFSVVVVTFLINFRFAR